MPRVLITLCRVAIGVIFLVAAWMKLQPGTELARGPWLFAQSIESFNLAPEWMIGPTAFILPWMEAICGVLLVLCQWLIPTHGLWGVAAALALSSVVVLSTMSTSLALRVRSHFGVPS